MAFFPWGKLVLCVLLYRKTKGGGTVDKSDIPFLLERRDEDGINLLIQYYGPLMRYIISPIVADDGDKEACMMESVMKMWDKISLYDPDRGRFATWVTVITRNTALNYVRRKAPLAISDEDLENVVDEALTPEEELIKREQSRALNKALKALPKHTRELLYRKYYYRQSTLQIATEMGMTERAVEGKLYRARKKLEILLGGELDDG